MNGAGIYIAPVGTPLPVTADEVDQLGWSALGVVTDPQFSFEQSEAEGDHRQLTEVLSLERVTFTWELSPEESHRMTRVLYPRAPKRARKAVRPFRIALRQARRWSRRYGQHARAVHPGQRGWLR